MEVPLADGGQAFQASPPDLRFAASVAAFGMILRDSPHKGDADLDKVLEWAKSGLGEDRGGLRAEFIQLADQARRLRAR